uniref:Immunoglobulin V-set domain-containing protein n=1 Tax=Catharus ustulatus TaxID=91951 RepID=A0A8C3U2A9_CATUS
MATYSSIHGQRLIGSFQKKVHFTRATPKASAITLQNLTLEDDSYYRCIFSVPFSFCCQQFLSSQWNSIPSCLLRVS